MHLNHPKTNHIMSVGFIWVEVSNNIEYLEYHQLKNLLLIGIHVFFCEITGSSLLLLSIEHWLAKKLLKILALSLKSVTNLSRSSSGGIQGIFVLFRKVFNIDQYDCWLVLGSNS